MQKIQSPRQMIKLLTYKKGNLELLHGHQESQNKIQDNFESEVFVVGSKHQDTNVYSIRPLNGKVPLCTVNWQQLFNLQKSQENTNTIDQDPDTTLSISLMKKFLAIRLPK